MDRQAVHDFLASRRARITPAQVGLPTYGEKRRVPGLRREEVLSPYAKAFFLEWDTMAQDMAGAVRTQAGRDPTDRGLSDLVGELTTRSDGFAARWARGDVRLHRTARKRLRNQVVGEIELTGYALDLAGDGANPERLLSRARQSGRGPAEAAGRLERHWGDWPDSVTGPERSGPR